MISLCIEGATHVFTGRGNSPLHVAVVEGGYYVSRWEPTPAEARMLAEGGCVELWVVGCQPAVAMRALPPPGVGA